MCKQLDCDMDEIASKQLKLFNTLSWTGPKYLSYFMYIPFLISSHITSWHLQCNESKHVNIWKTSADNEANVLMCLTVDSEFHYIVTVNGKQYELDWLELPNSISNIQDFLLILQSLDELNFCNGISVTKLFHYLKCK
jgi:predicted nuclease of predicted toxin-antitoxin system